jgi:uncharacterized protein YukE
MSNMYGLDVQAVRTLGSQLNSEADALDSTLRKLTTALEQTQWVGPDATKFRNEWQSQHSVALRNVIEALRATSNSAKQNADAQEQVSGS